MPISQAIYETWDVSDPKRGQWWEYIAPKFSLLDGMIDPVPDIGGDMTPHERYEDADEMEKSEWWRRFESNPDYTAHVAGWDAQQTTPTNTTTTTTTTSGGCDEPKKDYPGLTLRDNFKINKDAGLVPLDDLDKVQNECCKKKEFFLEECRQLHKDVAATLKKKGCPASVRSYKKKKGKSTKTTKADKKKLDKLKKLLIRKGISKKDQKMLLSKEKKNPGSVWWDDKTGINFSS